MTAAAATMEIGACNRVSYILIIRRNSLNGISGGNYY